MTVSRVTRQDRPVTDASIASMAGPGYLFKMPRTECAETKPASDHVVCPRPPRLCRVRFEIKLRGFPVIALLGTDGRYDSVSKDTRIDFYQCQYAYIGYS